LVAHTSPLLVTLAILFEPVGASTLGWVIFGERPGPLLLLGGAIVLVGVAIVAITHQDRAN
jgi:drug/metabolite transporter (DMT)-like permease